MEPKKKTKRRKKNSQARLPAEKESLPEEALQHFKELLDVYLEVGQSRKRHD